jgi:hypothetical protein
MATVLKLKSDIKKLKAAIGRKGTPSNLVPKLKSQLEKVENELASMQKGASPRKVSTTKSTSTALSKLQKMVQTKKYSSYQGAGVDLKKDADDSALPKGVRVSKGLKANQYGTAKQNKGKKYYEYRPNRFDVKQPKGKQTYPKLEDGGMMADGGGTKAGTVLKFDYNGMVFYDAKELFDVIDANVTTKKVVKFDAEVSVKQYATKYVGMTIDFTPDMSFNEFYNKLVRENSEYIWTSRIKKGGMMADGGKTEDEPKVIRGYSDDEAYEYAQGGALEHGLMVGDLVKGIKGNGIAIYNENTKESFMVDISKGSREKLSNMQFEKFSNGGHVMSKTHRYDK